MNMTIASHDAVHVRVKPEAYAAHCPACARAIIAREGLDSPAKFEAYVRSIASVKPTSHALLDVAFAVAEVFFSGAKS
jgi:hypothetical protein